MKNMLNNKKIMITFNIKNSLFFRTVLCAVLIAFLGTTIVPSSFAQVLSAPASTLVPLSPAFTPTLVRGIRVYPDNPLKFDFIVDSGDTGLKGDELKKESEKLIRYFLASLTIPEDELWVNLSPYEKDRIVPSELGETEMGRDMLAQDYLLKQITASLTNPDSDLGKEFWQKIYKKAYEQYGTTNIPVDTFNKVWIMPEKAVVYEQADKAFVVESKLKVMLEEDYVAAQQAHSPELIAHSNDQKSANSYELSTKNHELTSRIVREVFIPALEKEVNVGKNFAQLRQIYNAIILGYWFKTKLKNSILNKVYSNQHKTAGIDLSNKANTDKIYAQYLDTFKKGVCNMMKVEYDPYVKKSVPRKYFAGGVNVTNLEVGKNLTLTKDSSACSPLIKRALFTFVLAVTLALATPQGVIAQNIDPLPDTIPTLIIPKDTTKYLKDTNDKRPPVPQPKLRQRPNPKTIGRILLAEGIIKEDENIPSPAGEGIVVSSVVSSSIAHRKSPHGDEFYRAVYEYDTKKRHARNLENAIASIVNYLRNDGIRVIGPADKPDDRSIKLKIVDDKEFEIDNLYAGQDFLSLIKLEILRHKKQRMRDLSLLEPPVVILQFRYKSYLFDGHHRVYVALERGEKTIPAKIIDLSFLGDSYYRDKENLSSRYTKDFNLKNFIEMMEKGEFRMINGEISADLCQYYGHSLIFGGDSRTLTIDVLKRLKDIKRSDHVQAFVESLGKACYELREWDHKTKVTLALMRLKSRKPIVVSDEAFEGLQIALETQGDEIKAKNMIIQRASSSSVVGNMSSAFLEDNVLPLKSIADNIYGTRLEVSRNISSSIASAIKSIHEGSFNLLFRGDEAEMKALVKHGKEFFVEPSGKISKYTILYKHERTSLKIVEKDFVTHLGDPFKEFYAKAKANPEKPFIVVDAGSGAGVALKEMADKFRLEGINNVKLYGFSHIYYPEWAEGEYPEITWILDSFENIDEYFGSEVGKLGMVDFMFSHLGFYHMGRGQGQSFTTHINFMKKIPGFLASDAEVVYDYSRMLFNEKRFTEALSGFYNMRSQFKEIEDNTVQGFREAMIIRAKKISSGISKPIVKEMTTEESGIFIMMQGAVPVPIGQRMTIEDDLPLYVGIDNCLCVVFPKKKTMFHFSDLYYLLEYSEDMMEYLRSLFKGLEQEEAIIVDNNVYLKKSQTIRTSDVAKVLKNAFIADSNKGEYRQVLLYPNGTTLIINEKERALQDFEEAFGNAKDYINTFMSSGQIPSKPLIVSSSIPSQISEKFAQAGNEVDFETFMGWVNNYYYNDRAKIGSGRQIKDGGFDTFAESQQFGRVVARQIAEVWQTMVKEGKAKNTKFSVVEMGAGNGTLAKNILDYLKENEKELYSVIEYVIVDFSDIFVNIQTTKLAEHIGKIRHVKKSVLDVNEKDLGDIEGVFLSNELVDDLPGNLIQSNGKGAFSEVYIRYEDGALKEVLKPLSAEAKEYLEKNKITNVPSGKTFLIRPSSIDQWQQMIGRSLKKGVVLTIDYGGKFEEIIEDYKSGVWSGAEENNDRLERILINPGRGEITANVDFGALARKGAEVGLQTFGFVFQNDFLRNLWVPGDVDDTRLSQSSFSFTSPAFKVLIQSKGILGTNFKGFQENKEGISRFFSAYRRPVKIMLPSDFQGKKAYYAEVSAWDEIANVRSNLNGVIENLTRGYPRKIAGSLDVDKDNAVYFDFYDSRMERADLSKLIIFSEDKKIIFNFNEFFEKFSDEKKKCAFSQKDFIANYDARIAFDKSFLPTPWDFAIIKKNNESYLQAVVSSGVEVSSSNAVSITLPFELPKGSIDEAFKFSDTDIEHGLIQEMFKNGIFERFGDIFHVSAMEPNEEEGRYDPWVLSIGGGSFTREAFRHILDNAIFAIDKRRAQESGYIGKMTVSLLAHDGIIELIVEDNGVGISADVMEKLLKEPISRIDEEGYKRISVTIDENYRSIVQSVPGSFVEFDTRVMGSAKGQKFRFSENGAEGEKSSVTESDKKDIGTIVRFVFPVEKSSSTLSSESQEKIKNSIRILGEETVKKYNTLREDDPRINNKHAAAIVKNLKEIRKNIRVLEQSGNTKWLTPAGLESFQEGDVVAFVNGEQVFLYVCYGRSSMGASLAQFLSLDDLDELGLTHPGLNVDYYGIKKFHILDTGKKAVSKPSEKQVKGTLPAADKDVMSSAIGSIVSKYYLGEKEGIPEIAQWFSHYGDAGFTDDQLDAVILKALRGMPFNPGGKSFGFIRDQLADREQEQVALGKTVTNLAADGVNEITVTTYGGGEKLFNEDPEKGLSEFQQALKTIVETYDVQKKKTEIVLIAYDHNRAFLQNYSEQFKALVSAFELENPDWKGLVKYHVRYGDILDETQRKAIATPSNITFWRHTWVGAERVDPEDERLNIDEMKAFADDLYSAIGQGVLIVNEEVALSNDWDEDGGERDYLFFQKAKVSSAVNSGKDRKGGIDFNADGMNLQTKGQGIDFTLPENLQNLRPEDITGFTPVIINITPVTDMYQLLGFSKKDIEKEGLQEVTKASHDWLLKSYDGLQKVIKGCRDELKEKKDWISFCFSATNSNYNVVRNFSNPLVAISNFMEKNV